MAPTGPPRAPDLRSDLCLIPLSLPLSISPLGLPAALTLIKPVRGCDLWLSVLESVDVLMRVCVCVGVWVGGCLWMAHAQEQTHILTHTFLNSFFEPTNHINKKDSNVSRDEMHPLTLMGTEHIAGGTAAYYS